MNIVSGTITGSNVSLTLNEGGNLFSATATLNGDGSMAGAYQGNNGSCKDSGVFTATKVNQVGGPYAGTLSLSEDSYYSVYETIIKTQGDNLTANVDVASSDGNGSFVMSGTDIGGGVFLTGSFKEATLSYYGYTDGVSGSLLLYDASSSAYVGSLVPTSVR